MSNETKGLPPAVEPELETYFGLYSALKEDVDSWWSRLNEHRDDIAVRRAVVRATFAFIEGVLHGLKRLAIGMQSAQPILDKQDNCRTPGCILRAGRQRNGENEATTA
jgi:hypothetical protein